MTHKNDVKNIFNSLRYHIGTATIAHCYVNSTRLSGGVDVVYFWDLGEYGRYWPLLVKAKTSMTSQTCHITRECIIEGQAVDHHLT